MVRLTDGKLDRMAQSILRDYLGEGCGMLQAVDMERMAREYFGLDVRYEQLSQDGRMTGVSVLSDANVRLWRAGRETAVAVRGGTILLERSLKADCGGAGRRNLAIARECACQLLFWKEPDAARRASRLFQPSAVYTPQQLRALSGGAAEWEIGRFASSLLLPASTVDGLLKIFYRDELVCVYGRGRLNDKDRQVLSGVARILCVPWSTLMIRLWQLHRIVVLPANAPQEAGMSVERAFAAV